MSIEVTTKKRFEEDIESFFLSLVGGYTNELDACNVQLKLYTDVLIDWQVI